MNYLGLEIGGTKIQLRAENEQGELLWQERFAAGSNARQIRQQIERIIRQRGPDAPLHAVGVGFGGPINYQTGRISQSFHVEGWQEFGLTHWLKTRLDCPVYADNDANVAALGEALRGVGHPFQQVYYVTIGSGVGSGYVRDGAILHGRPPGEWEIGHLRLDQQGTSLQSVASGWGIDERIRRQAVHHPASTLARQASRDPGFEARHLGFALDQHDAFAGHILAETVRALAWALSHVIHLVHPQVLVLGGGVTGLGERFRLAIEQSLSAYVMPSFQPLPPLLLSGLGEQVVPIGAIELAKQQLKTDKNPNDY